MTSQIMKELLIEISSEYSKAFNYFSEYYTNEFDNRGLKLEDLPFEMGLGVFLHFFNHINSDIDLYSYEKEALIDAVKEAFSTYEEYLFLDS
jgi:hypothetical protein